MYLSDVLILNSGPISELRITPKFNPDGSPKPIALVGGNGSGKTNILSILADSTMELAANHFSDILPSSGPYSHEYYRTLGSSTIRSGAAYELYIARFTHSNDNIYVRGRAGKVTPAELASKLIDFASAANWTGDEANKEVIGPTNNIEKIFRSGCYLYFPSSRSEKPIWLNSRDAEERTQPLFAPMMVNLLRKPVLVESVITDTLPWVTDVILDLSVDAITILQANDLNKLKSDANVPLRNIQALINLNAIVQQITRNPKARVIKTNRTAGDRRILIIGEGDKILVPGLRAFSSGQATLFAIFTTILRYGDAGQFARASSDIEGIALIDEIDAHLHSEFQFDVLPNLMRMFPRVQFLISTHSPLFLLGMKNVYGDDGFSIVELPSGAIINVERFSEFEKSLSSFRATKAFETEVQERVSKLKRPLILCEGETDPIYLRTAAGILGLNRLANEVDFDWVGQRTEQGAEGSGKDALNDAHKFLKNNPAFVSATTVLLYDPDARKPDSDHGKLYVRGLPLNEENSVCLAGIENLFPQSVFRSEFYEKSVKRTADVITRDILQKKKLCEFLCGEAIDLTNFGKFEQPLRQLEALIFS